MNFKKFKLCRAPLAVLFFLISFFSYSQQFTEVESRPLSEMKINYGNAVADYDLDGDLDVFIVAYNSFDANDQTTWSRLLENINGRLEDVTKDAGFGIQHSNAQKQDLKLGASWGDYDNDGYPDILLSHQNGTQLYKNMGNKTFKDVTRTAKIEPCLSCNNSGSLWWDYDNDGDLDLYLFYLEDENRLFNNQADGTFKEIIGALNINDGNRTWSSLPIDANHDGWLDLYVVNDFGLSNFYLSQEGESFINATDIYNLRNTGCGMGSTIGDFNNDGYYDIYVTNIAETKKNPLFMGTAEGPFVNVTNQEGVGNGHYGWGTRFLDADNDGDQDLYVVNGEADLHYENVFFKNLRKEGEKKFDDWTNESAANGLNNGMGAEVFDYDQDGDLDILVSNTNNAPYLYKNTTAISDAWLQVSLEGITSNKNAFGAKLIAYVEGDSIHRLLHGATIMGQSVKPAHFGLGDVNKIDSLFIQWPNSIPEKIYDIAINQKIKIVEQQGMQKGEFFNLEEEEEGTPEIDSPIFDEIPNDKLLEKDLIVHPNPFKEYITFNFLNKETGVLRLSIYTIIGAKVFSLEQEVNATHDWILQWNGESNNGVKLTSGLYVYKVSLANKKWSGKLLLN
ncbi:putative secreted protein (Por secretion system target) [Maribacter vaceletii]|uniref:Putative secreted protein (Por secretion system target) n=1 Tax=Maribacter vaceletii TaxID=1206816 RepID=A0A495EC11_9FLAO|nr:CRTAC1 family protein [Maribacter vaceletii]RKR14400.1 putative secreted protein (Por secretion system target) [Maribacter vaceletii]